MKAARNSAIGCAILLAVIEGVGIGIQRMMAEQTRLDVRLCEIAPHGNGRCADQPSIGTASASTTCSYRGIAFYDDCLIQPSTFSILMACILRYLLLIFHSSMSLDGHPSVESPGCGRQQYVRRRSW